MSTAPSSLPLATITTRLRAAGCVFAEDEARLLVATAPHPAELSTMVARRVAGLPLEHILGWAEFANLRIAVEPGVFVPRHRTEFLANLAIDLARQAADAGPARRRPVVADLCCGSGAVGAVVATAVPGIELHAVDIDPAAVRCARRNLAVDARVYQGDLYEPLPVTLRGRVDVLVANAPYVPTEAIRLLPAEARDHEPRRALDGGVDGIDLHRRLAAAALSWLAPDGHLLVETSRRQSPQSADAFARGGLVPRIAHCDDRDATVVIGTPA